MAQRERNQGVAPAVEERIALDDEGARPLGVKRLEAG
jgi:hypothetical protein